MPTAADMDELIAFLPRLYAPGFEPIVRWHGGDKNKDGVITMPYPEYHAVTEEFFGAVANPCWRNYDYSPEQAGAMLQDDKAIKSASLADLRTMLTLCVRSERFGDGSWGGLITSGRIRALLERLQQLRAEVPADR